MSRSTWRYESDSGMLVHVIKLRHFSFASTLLLAACASAPASQGLEAMYRGKISDVTERSFREADAQAELDALWASAFGRVASPPPEPAVDFSQQRVLVVFMGRQMRGGHGFDILVTGMEESPDAIEVRVLFTAPGAHCHTEMVITHPYAVFLLPAGPKPLRYVTRDTVNGC